MNHFLGKKKIINVECSIMELHVQHAGPGYPALGLNVSREWKVQGLILQAYKHLKGHRRMWEAFGYIYWVSLSSWFGTMIDFI